MMKLNRARLKEDLKEVAGRIRALKDASARKRGKARHDLVCLSCRHVGGCACTDHVDCRILEVQVAKRPILKQGRERTTDEWKNLLWLKRQATMLCAISAISRGKLHCRQLIKSPEDLRELAKAWEGYRTLQAYKITKHNPDGSVVLGVAHEVR